MTQAESFHVDAFVDTPVTLPAAERRPPRRTSPTFRLVPLPCYEVEEPPASSRVRLSNVARRALQTWPPERQRALYLEVPKRSGTGIPLIRHGDEAHATEGGHYVMVSRRSDGWCIEGIFDRPPVGA